MADLRNWSELPDELLTLIAEKVESIEEFTRFGAVCRSWRFVTVDKRYFASILKPSLPWLMLTANDDETSRNFFVPWQNKIRQINLPEVRGRHCWGSPFGWIVTFGIDQQFHLFNILSGARLLLPPRSTFKDLSYPEKNLRMCVSKAVVVPLSPPILSDGYLVFVCIGGYRKLAFARPGDTTWTVVRNTTLVMDVIYLNGLVYMVSGRENIRVCDINVAKPVAKRFASLPDDTDGTDRFYLLECDGELHMVARFLEPSDPDYPPVESHHNYETLGFDVYKLDLTTRTWTELETLGDHAFFIGSNTSFSLKASKYDQACSPGCIYFTDDCDEACGRLIGEAMGIYNFETDTFETLYSGDGSVSRFSPPLWVTPNPF